MISFTLPEIRRLLAHLLLQHAAPAEHVWSWSCWRRRRGRGVRRARRHRCGIRHRSALGGVSMLVVDLCDVTFIGSIPAAIVTDVLRNRSDVQVLKIVNGRCGAQVFTMVGLTETADCFSNRSPT
jgi:hypothetical protein